MLIPIFDRLYNPAKNGRQVIKAINKHNVFDIFTYEINEKVYGYILGFAPKNDVMDVMFYHIKDSNISLDELFEEFMERTIEFKLDCVSNNFVQKDIDIDTLTRRSLFEIPYIGAILTF
jgi:hypothetical protein